ncbi:hypothetical protein Ae201684P_000293 [Aphanomyces euteiches]|nr:hypothetical protein Ae201684P_000293 [Aphanomyces euteiches]
MSLSSVWAKPSKKRGIFLKLWQTLVTLNSTLKRTFHSSSVGCTWSDVNLNSDMLDDPDFFWDDDEHQPLYKKMMKYLDVDNRVQILNTRLDVLRELLDVLNEHLARQHDTNLEWICIWVIVAAVFVKIFWNIVVKDFLGLFCHP